MIRVKPIKRNTNPKDKKSSAEYLITFTLQPTLNRNRYKKYKNDHINDTF